MKIESQVCSLELAKELKAFGVRQESVFWWIADILVFKTQTGFYNILGAGMNLHPYAENAIAAPTVAELGEMLPSGFCTSWKLLAHDAQCIGEPRMPYGFQADTEADARAKMLIYLIENGLCPSPSKT